MWIFKLNFYSFRSYTEVTESNGCPRPVIKSMDLHLQFPIPQRRLTFSWLFSCLPSLNDMLFWLVPSSRFSFHLWTFHSGKCGLGSPEPRSTQWPWLSFLCVYPFFWWSVSFSSFLRKCEPETKLWPHTSENASCLSLMLGGRYWILAWKRFSLRCQKASSSYPPASRAAFQSWMSLLLLILSVKTALFCLKACSSLVPASAQVRSIYLLF